MSVRRLCIHSSINFLSSESGCLSTLLSQKNSKARCWTGVQLQLVNITDAAMVTMVANGSYMYGPSNLYHTGSPQDDKPLVDVALECGLVGADRKRMRVRTTLRRARYGSREVLPLIWDVPNSITN